jgi:hypothetical protein
MVRSVSAGSNKSLESKRSSAKLPKIRCESKIEKSETSSRLLGTESPTRKLIKEMTERMHPFDIYRILKWNSENIRKYRTFILKFEHPDVMMNLMLLDK